MLCIFHKDNDGYASAAIVRRQFPKCDLYAINYGYEVPWARIQRHADEGVIIVDFTLQPMEDMQRLHTMLGDKLTWIDHHISTIRSAGSYGLTDVPGIRKSGVAGCELTWQYYFPDEAMPKSVRMFGRYDVWDHANYPDALPFHYGFGILPASTQVKDPLWHDILNDNITDRIIKEGKLILKYVQNQNKMLSSCLSFETELDGYTAIAANTSGNSMVLESVYDPKVHDLMILFEWTSRHFWTVSLYSDKIDVSKIAKRHKGGGHKGAAGFQCQELPFEV